MQGSGAWFRSRSALALSAWMGVLSAGLAACDGDSADDSASDRRGAATREVAERSAALESTLTLPVTQDTSIRLTAPSKNFGAAAELDVNRALLKLEPSELTALIQPGDYVISAQLELTLVDRAARRGQVARPLGAHRVLKPWTESGATWLCPVDTNPSNTRPDCPNNAWSPLGGGSFVESASASSVIPASRSGVVTLDVTSDVRAFADGTLPNQGWLLKTNSIAVLDVADFASAESATPPRLVLKLRREDPKVVINEVESSGGTPGDWVELYNAGHSAVDLSGYRFKDNDDTHAFYIMPAGTSIAAGAYLVIEEAQFGFGLGSADSARLFAPSGDAPVETYSWTAHAAITYGRCPNGSGPFGANATSTKGAANDCSHPVDAGIDAGSDAGSPFSAWPGTNSVTTVDAVETFTGNLSGLSYQPATSGPAVLWAVTNSPSRLYRLEYDGALWLPTASDGWSQGKTLVYPTGTGGPDSEGVTKAEWESPFLYVATERDNSLNTVSRLAILRFDTSGLGSTLVATHEWNLTTDLPVVGPNLGLEAITWIPDSYLVSAGFRDESTNATYDPAQYPDHGSGVFFVGVEASGMIYAYTLNHASGSFQRVASVPSGQAGTMGLEFDRDRNTLWSYCDDTCGNRSTLLSVSSAAPSFGQFVVRVQFDRPSALPNINNEGIAFAPESGCVAGFRSFFWADDADTDGHSLRQGTIPCAPLY